MNLTTTYYQEKINQIIDLYNIEEVSEEKNATIKNLLKELQKDFSKIELLDEKFPNAKQLQQTNSAPTYKELFEENQIMNLLVDASNGNIIDANTSLTGYFGFSYNEIINKNINELIACPPSWFSKNMEAQNKIIVLQHTTKNGEVRHLEVNCKAIKKADSIFYNIFIFDIEEKISNEIKMAKLSEAVKQSPTTIVITDLEGSIEYVNPHFTELTGYTFEDAVGNNPRILKTALTPELTFVDLWKTIIGGKTWKGEFVNKRKDGSFFWEKATIAPIRNQQDKMVGYVAIKENITEQKEAEATLNELNEELKKTNENLFKTNEKIKAEREQFLSLLDSIPEIIYVSDILTSKVLFVNKALIETYGRDITGEKCYEALQEKSSVCSFCTNKIIVNKNEPHFWEYHNGVINKDFYIIDRYVKWYDNQPARFELSIDISKLKNAEKKLQQQKIQFEAIFENANIGTCLIDINGKFLKVNQQMTDIFGYEKEDFLALSVDDITFPDDKNITADFVKKVVAGEIEKSKYEKRYLHKNGKIVYCLVSATFVEDKENNLQHFITHINDITSQKQIENTLIESEKKYRFMYENINDLICLHSQEGFFIEVSPSVEKILGYKVEEMLGNVRSAFLHPDDVEKVRSIGLQKTAIGEGFKIKYRFRKKDGSYIWLETISDVIKDSNSNNVKQIMTSSRDVTQTVNYVQRLNKTNLILRKIQEVLADSLQGNFNQKMVTAISTILNADIAFIGQFTDSIKTKIKTIALFTENKIGENIEYELKNTPCETVLNEIKYCYPSNIQEVFPDDEILKQFNLQGYIGLPLFSSANTPIGIVAALYKQPIEEPDFYKYIFQIFSSRISAEMERTTTENALKASEEKYRLIAENASDVIWILNVNKQIFNYISPSVFQLRGYTAEEALQQNFAESLTPESVKIVMQEANEIIPKFLQNPESFHSKIFTNQLQQPCKDGSIVWIETTTRYRFNSLKEIEVVGISRNIEQRMKQDSELKRRLKYEESISKCSAILLQGKQDAINEGLNFVLNGTETSRIYIFENFIDHNNKLFMRQTHEVCAPEVPTEFNNQNLQTLYYQEHGFSRWAELLQNNEVVEGIVENFPQNEKDILVPQQIKSILVIPLWVNAKWFGFIGFDDIWNNRIWNSEDVNLLRSVSEMIGLYIENTGNKQIIIDNNLKLKELNATKDKFFSIVAHDLKNPFNSIIGFTDLLRNNLHKYDTQKIEKFVNSIHVASSSAYKLLQNLLEWAKAQTGRIEFNPDIFVLENAVLESIRLVQGQANNKKINISYEINDVLLVNADRNMLNTILRNLFSNAIKFTHREGKILLKALKKNDIIEVAIIDNGVGMDEKTRNKLFNISEKASSKGTENEEGTGLGLLLCKEFIARHNGQIWVESQKGVGSVFTFTVPAGN